MFPNAYIYPTPAGFRLAIDSDKLPGIFDTLRNANIASKLDRETTFGFNGTSIDKYTILRIENGTKRQLELLFHCTIVENSGSPATISLVC
jgi:hypothetical protein